MSFFQRYEELKRLFIAALRDSSVFPVPSHSLMLLLELKMLTDDEQLISLVDTLIERFARRLYFAKLQEDHRRIGKVIRAVLGAAPKDASSLSSVLRSLDRLIKLGLYHTGVPFLAAYLAYVRLLGRITKDGVLLKDLLVQNPSAGVLSRILLRNEDLLSVCDRYEQSAVVPPVLFRSTSQKRSDKLDLIGLRRCIELCERTVLKNAELHAVLRLMSAVMSFIDQVVVFLHERGVDGCCLAPRSEVSPELQAFIAEFEPHVGNADSAGGFAQIVCLRMWGGHRLRAVRPEIGECLGNAALP
jgi:hypothetical protein